MQQIDLATATRRKRATKFKGNYTVVMPDGSEYLMDQSLGRVSQHAIKSVLDDLIKNRYTANFLVDQQFPLEYYAMVVSKGYALKEAENRCLLALHALNFGKRGNFQ